MVFIGIALFKDFESTKKTIGVQINDEGMNVYDKIDYLTKVISPIMLPMISGLGDLREDEIKIQF